VAQLYLRALGSLYVASYDSQGYGGGILTHPQPGGTGPGVYSLQKYRMVLVLLRAPYGSVWSHCNLAVRAAVLCLTVLQLVTERTGTPTECQAAGGNARDVHNPSPWSLSIVAVMQAKVNLNRLPQSLPNFGFIIIIIIIGEGIFLRHGLPQKVLPDCFFLNSLLAIRITLDSIS
jgi:hypothetical protein